MNLVRSKFLPHPAHHRPDTPCPSVYCGVGDALTPRDERPMPHSFCSSAEHSLTHLVDCGILAAHGEGRVKTWGSVLGGAECG